MSHSHITTTSDKLPMISIHSRPFSVNSSWSRLFWLFPNISDQFWPSPTNFHLFSTNYHCFRPLLAPHFHLFLSISNHFRLFLIYMMSFLVSSDQLRTISEPLLVIRNLTIFLIVLNKPPDTSSFCYGYISFYLGYLVVYNTCKITHKKEEEAVLPSYFSSQFSA